MTPMWRPPRVMAAAVFALGACSFDARGPAGELPGTDVDAGTAAPDDAAAECPEALHVEMWVGGKSAAEAGEEPLVTVLLGDTVLLSAAGSCSQAGMVRHVWEFEDAGLAATANPGTRREQLTVFPGAPGTYRITLTVSDDAGRSESVSVIGIRAFRWQRIGGVDVRDVAAGAGRIWIASSSGARFIDLADPGAGAQELNPVASGAEIDSDLGSVHYADRAGLVWFGRRGRSPQVWRVDGSLDIAAVAFPIEVAEAEVRDISAQGDGIAVATADGLLVAPDNQALAAIVIQDLDIFAITENTAGVWLGGNRLFDLANGVSSNPFNNDDNRIRALASEADRVWIGSDNRGVARLQTSDGSVETYSAADMELPSDRIRALAADTSGDVWAATDRGIARFKRGHGWISMDESTGLGDVSNASAIAVVEEAGKRLVVAGGTAGIAILGIEEELAGP